MAELTELVEHRPRTVLAAFLAVHALVWTALPALLYYNLPLDVIEAMTYGREWQLGYDKLPPLPWFLGEIAYRLTGHDASLYALSQAAVIVAFIAVWMTARPLVGVAGALAALLIIDGMHYFNLSAVKFNHNVIEMPLWALAGFAFHAGLRQGKLHSWILLGVALGLAWWAKYFVVILAAPLALFLLFDPDARRRLAAPGPWIAAIVTLVVVAPNLYWLWQHGSQPFGYAEARAAAPSGVLDHLTHPLEFVGGQAFFLLPALLIAAPLFWPPAKPAPGPRADAFDRRIVSLLAFGPALTLFVFSLVTGRATNAMWGFPLWLFIGLWIVLFAPAALDRARLMRIGAIWAVVFVILAAAFCADYLVLPRYDHRYRAAFFPGDRLSGRSRNASNRRPARSPLTSSARCGTAAMSRTTPASARSRACWSMACPIMRPGSILPICANAAPLSCGPKATRTCSRQIWRLPLPERRSAYRSTCPTIAAKASCMWAGQSCRRKRLISRA